MKKSVLVALLLPLMAVDVSAQNDNRQDTSFKPPGKLCGSVFGGYAYKLLTGWTTQRHPTIFRGKRTITIHSIFAGVPAIRPPVYLRDPFTHHPRTRTGGGGRRQRSRFAAGAADVLSAKHAAVFTCLTK